MPRLGSEKSSVLRKEKIVMMGILINPDRKYLKKSHAWNKNAGDSLLMITTIFLSSSYHQSG